MTTKLNFEHVLKEKLGRFNLRPERPDKDTLLLNSVPADAATFNKPKTNLLIKQMHEIARCVVCVDEDLEYRGTDPELSCAFAAGRRQEGWRILTFGGRLDGDLAVTLDYALNLLGIEKSDDAPRIAAVRNPHRLLATAATCITSEVEGEFHRRTLHRDEEVERAAACALSWSGRIPLITGDPGVGKTNLLYGVARLLHHFPRSKALYSVNLGVAMSGLLLTSERESLLRSLLEEAREAEVVLAIEQAEWATIGVPRGLVLLREAADRGARFMATSTPEGARSLCSAPLESKLEVIQLKDLCAPDAGQVLEELKHSIATHHDVIFDAEVINAVVEECLPLPGHLPGKAINLLDAAAARASLGGAVKVTLLDVYLAASRVMEKE